MVWFMNINLTDDRTTVGSYDNRSSGGVILMPKERHMRGGAPIQPHANALLCAKHAGRFRHWSRRTRASTKTRQRPSPSRPTRKGKIRNRASADFPLFFSKRKTPCRVWFLATTITLTFFSSLALGSLSVVTQPPIELGWLFGCCTPKRTAGGAVCETPQRPGFINHARSVVEFCELP